MRASFAERGPVLPSLLYHHVGPSLPGDQHADLSVCPAVFARQIQWLARRGYTGISPSEWLSWYRGERSLPEKPVLITFDDAYADIAAYAFPVLSQHGFSAGVYVITQLVEAGESWVGRALMTRDHIRTWANHGIEFGGHTRTHADLPTLTAPRLREEVAGCADDLSAVLGRQVVSFAYPYGFYNSQVQAAVRDVFSLALTCDEGLNDRRTDLTLVRRTMVQPADSLLDIACRVRLGWSPVNELRRHFRLRSRLKRVLQRVLPSRAHE